ncbi:MAG: site-specific integrase [Bacteroidetes bacterium]|nr:site-specific integrase [Bacteroidota bacterium]
MANSLTHDSVNSRVQGTDTPPGVSPSTQRLIQSSVSENTRIAYERALSKLKRWLDGQMLTDARLSEYLAIRHEQGWASSSIAVTPAAVRFASRLADTEATIGALTERTLAGIRREGRHRGRGQVTGMTFTGTRFLVGQIAKNGVKGVRDATLFSPMSDCMLRISELVLSAPLTLKPSRTNRGDFTSPQARQTGRERGYALCRPAHPGAYPRLAPSDGRSTGRCSCPCPSFSLSARGSHIQQSGVSVQGIRKNLTAYVKQAGLKGRYSGHSFRIGTATLAQMQTVGRWQTSRMSAAYCRNDLAQGGALSRSCCMGWVRLQARGTHERLRKEYFYYAPESCAAGHGGSCSKRGRVVAVSGAC